nr:unnamed protein product [Haemonchus contortus]
MCRQRERTNLVRRFRRETIRTGIISWCRSHQDWSFLAKNSSTACEAVNGKRGGHRQSPTGKHATGYPFERRSDQGSGVVLVRNSRSPDITQHYSQSGGTPLEKTAGEERTDQEQCFPGGLQRSTTFGADGQRLGVTTSTGATRSRPTKPTK